MLVSGCGANGRRGRLSGLSLLLRLLLTGLGLSLGLRPLLLSLSLSLGLSPLLSLGLLRLLLAARLLSLLGLPPLLIGLRPLLLARLVLDLALLQRKLAGLIGLNALLLISQQGPGPVVMLALLRRQLAGLIVLSALLLLLLLLLDHPIADLVVPLTLVARLLAGLIVTNSLGLLLLSQLGARLVVALMLLIGRLALGHGLILHLSPLILGQAAIRRGLSRLGLNRRDRARRILAHRRLDLGLTDSSVATRRARLTAQGGRRGALEIGLSPAVEPLSVVLTAAALGLPARLLVRGVCGIIGEPGALAASDGRQMGPLRRDLGARRRPIGGRYAAPVGRARGAEQALGPRQIAPGQIGATIDLVVPQQTALAVVNHHQTGTIEAIGIAAVTHEVGQARARPVIVVAPTVRGGFDELLAVRPLPGPRADPVVVEGVIRRRIFVGVALVVGLVQIGVVLVAIGHPPHWSPAGGRQGVRRGRTAQGRGRGGGQRQGVGGGRLGHGGGVIRAIAGRKAAKADRSDEGEGRGTEKTVATDHRRTPVG